MSTFSVRTLRPGPAAAMTLLAVFIATLPGAPAQVAKQGAGNDIVFPPVPLQAGPRPPPNLMFMLDTGDWMVRDEVLNPEFPRMAGFPLTPDTIRTAQDRAGRRVWLEPVGNPQNANLVPSLQNRNLLSYSPRITYLPWKLADGSLAPAADPKAAFSHASLTVVHPARPGGAITAAPGVKRINLQGNMREFYVPRLGMSARADVLNPENYLLYRLRGPDRAERCVVARKDAGGNWNRAPICEPVTSFTWDRAEGGPLVRSVEEEWRNYANWHAYHNTRLKALKAGASHAFADAGSDLRVGFWNARRSDYWMESHIPVKSAEGRFLDDPDAGVFNRTRWFQELYKAENNRGTGTNLHKALWNAGRYYARRDEDGPWAPLPGHAIGANHVACRRNAVMLATDGQWSYRDGYPPVGNADGGEDAPFRDGYADTLADVAFKLWKTDLRPDLTNVVPTSPRDGADWQHLVVHAVSVAPRGTLRDSDVGKRNWPDPGIPFPANVNLLPQKIDDLRHAAVNGRGRFMPSTRVGEFVDALGEILIDDSEVKGSGTSLRTDGGSVRDDSLSYVASFVTGQWTGDVTAYPMGTDGPGKQPLWKASRGIPGDPAKRTLLTLGPGNGRVPVAFPTAAQREVLTPEVADYLRGDRRDEGTRFRRRASLFGDVINSTPVYLSADGVATIFVGANDGMLHAIDARTGAERFAYVPALLDMEALKEHGRPQGFVHRYHVDGPLAVSSRAQTPGKHVLVGTLGRGGRGVFGLDVSKPRSFAASGRAWEYAGDADMGMVLGQPQFARMGVQGQVKATVLVPNGVNSPDGKAVLYVLEAETGKLIGKVPTNAETGNGLSTPTVLDSDGNGLVDSAYAGDLRGNVWRFDMTNRDPGRWKAERVFTATDRKGRRQPVTGGIGVAYHPVTLRPWVFLGTGRYLAASDPFDQGEQSWYGVEDIDKPVSRGELRRREAIPAYQTGIGADQRQGVRAFESARPGDMEGKRGWVMDLLPARDPDGKISGYANGERMIGNQLVVGGEVLAAASIIPDTANCGSGRGLLNFVDAFTGGAVSKPFLDYNGDGRFDGGDSLLLPGGQGKQALGSVDLGVGMVTDPLVLLGNLKDAGTPAGLPMFCASGNAGEPGCIKFSWGMGGFGRVGWSETR